MQLKKNTPNSPDGSSFIKPAAFHPYFEEAEKRWQAYFAGEMIDRPVVCVTAPLKQRKGGKSYGYHERVFGDMNEIIDEALAGAEATYFGGESIPCFGPSMGTDEIAVFCGARLAWHDESKHTNWSIPFVEDWNRSLPLAIQSGHPLWQRVLAFYRLAADRMIGKMALASLDLHSNMDLLAAARGPERLCMDLLDQPETIDRAMASARSVFPALWNSISRAGRMDEAGYASTFYSTEGAACLQCDFSCMIGPEMFRRWVLPALEEEAQIVKHAVYHWDGPGALVHMKDLMASKGLHTFSYVPGTGHGELIDHIDLYQRIQRAGKAVLVWGSPDEVKSMHKLLQPAKTIYVTWAGGPDQAEELLAWFVKNT